VYGRQVKDRLLSFGHEGVLYRRSFVFYDRQTDSLWVHTTGQAVKGELRGTQLEFLPSEVLPWSEWRAQHPDTLVLDRGGLDTDFMGTFGIEDESEEYGISVGGGRGGATPVLYPFDRLVELGLVNDGPRVVLYDEDSASVRAWERQGRKFEWGAQGTLRDASGATWDTLTGRALEVGGVDLTRIPATAWLIERWEGFYPRGDEFDD